MNLSKTLILGTACWISASSFSMARAAGLASIRLTATRSVIKADGNSSTVIIADVQDDQGRNIADGTRVLFAITSGQGHLDTSVVATQGGQARVRFTAADTPGSALITVNLETPGLSTPAQTVIRFAADVDAAETGTKFIHIEGRNYLAFAGDYGIVQADGKNGMARVSYRNTTITANSIQVDARNAHVVAVGQVTLEHGREKRRYLTLQYDLLRNEGSGERDEEGRPRPVAVQDTTLIEAPLKFTDNLARPEQWQLQSLYDSRLIVKSKAIDLETGSRIEFRRATYYADGKKTVSFPYQVWDLKDRSNGIGKVIGYNAEGLTVDLPYYYDVRPSGIGTLHVRRGALANGSAYSARPGWSLDFEQSYNTAASNTDGTFELLGVTRPNWGARLRHNQELGGGISSNLFLDLPNHQDLFATTQLTRQFPGFNLSATGTGSRRIVSDLLSNGKAISGDLRGQLDADTPARAFFRIPTVRYSFNLSAARQSYYGQNALTLGVINTQTAGMRMFTTPLTLTQATTLTQSLSFGQNWIGGGGVSGQRSGIFVRGTTALTRGFGSAGSGTLTYEYQQSPLASSYSGSLISHHRLGFDSSVNSGGRWRFSFNGSRGLDTPEDSISSGIRLNPNYASGPWGFSVRYYASRYDTFRSNEFEYALLRQIGQQDFAIFYSTTARRFQLDFTGARF